MKTLKKSLTVTAILVALLIIFYGCSKSTSEKTNSTDNKNLKTASNKGEKLNLVLSESNLEWSGKKITGQHNGTVDIKSGDLYLDNGKLTGGNFEIDFTTIKVLQLDDPELNAKLTGHLKSNDFFSAQSFPTGKFEIKSLAPLSNGNDNNYTVSGNLTIKGITKEITFPAKVLINGNTVIASADFNIDRTLWDIKFRSGKFYENLGDNLISDEINIKFNISAKQI